MEDVKVVLMNQRDLSEWFVTEQGKNVTKR